MQEAPDTAVPERRPSRMRDVARGIAYALLILLSILFYSGMASTFVYVDF